MKLTQTQKEQLADCIADLIENGKCDAVYETAEVYYQDGPFHPYIRRRVFRIRIEEEFRDY